MQRQGSWPAPRPDRAWQGFRGVLRTVGVGMNDSVFIDMRICGGTRVRDDRGVRDGAHIVVIGSVGSGGAVRRHTGVHRYRRV